MPDFLEQRGLEVFGSSGPGPVASTVSLPSSVDATRAFPRLLGFRHTGAGRDTESTDTLANRDLGALVDTWGASSFRLERNALAELQDHRYYWAVLEDRTPTALQPYHGFYLRDLGSFRLTAGNATHTGAAITSISDPAQAMLWPVAIRSADAGQAWSNATIEAYVDSSKRVQIIRNESGSFGNLTWAVLEMGSVWRVRRLSGTVTTRGADVELSGAGATPWTRKFYVATQRAPAGANDLADYVLIRTSKTDPDKLVLSLPTSGTAGTYTVSVYVLEHPLLSVSHWDTEDFAGYPLIGVNATEEFSGSPLGPPVDPSAVSVICHSDGEGANTSYPRAHWGYTLADDGRVFFRRSRTAPRGQRYSAQFVTWPNPSRGGSIIGPGHTTTSRAV